MPDIVWSYGGGAQTAAIAVLIAQSRLPRPTQIIMADTGRETVTTMRYLNEHIAPLLDSVGLAVTILPHTYAHYDLYYPYTDGREATLPSMPMWTTKNGTTSLMPGHCSGVWKRDAVRKYLREIGYGRTKPIIQWLGFSRDEISRCKPSGRKWIENQYPLIDGYSVTITRSECVEIVVDAGLPSPPKSRCWMCPYQNQSEWRDIKSRPEEWNSAIALDRQLRDRDIEKSIYLHRSGVPLELAELSDKPLPLFDYTSMECQDGCWV